MKVVPAVSIHPGDCAQKIPKMIPPGTVDLIIADPPYFKVIGEKWDYKWRTEEDYVKWSSEWIGPAADSLRLGGSFYIFGYFRVLTRLIPMMESHGLRLRQQIILDKGIKAISGRATKGYKMYPNVTESLLFFIKDPIPYSRQLLKSRQQALGISAKEINERLGVKSNGGGMWSIYTGKNICEQLPTRETWEKLQEILKFDVPYGTINITFNTELGITDVWSDIDFYEERGSRIHPTQKPLKLIERLVRVSSNAGDLILDPFMGSGTTAVAACRLGRRCIGFELDETHAREANARLKTALSATQT